MYKILLVEDDKQLSDDITAQLQYEGFETEQVWDGLIAEKLILRNSYDCILLDVNLPGKSGYELCAGIRQSAISTPVIMLTAFGEIDDKLQGFDSGADDYITKPFFFKELLARIRVFLKRSEHYSQQPDEYILEDLVINTQMKQVSRSGQIIRLTAREYAVLHLLAEAKGRPVSKIDILKQVWGSAFDSSMNTLEVYINLLRNKIDKEYSPKLIHTRIGFGYYLSDQAEV